MTSSHTLKSGVSNGGKKMEFKATLTTRTTLKKKKKYIFDFTEEDIKKGRNATFENPYFCNRKKNSIWFAIYMWKDKLTVTMFHSFDKFEEVMPNSSQD